MTTRNKKTTGKGTKSTLPSRKPNTKKQAGSDKAGRSHGLRERRRYSDEERGTALAALDLNEGNVLKTAEQLDIPRKTLEGWVKDRKNAAVAEIRQVKKAELGQKFGTIAEKSLGFLENRLEDLSPRDLAWVAAVSSDKWLLMNDQPTVIAVSVSAEDVVAARAVTTEWERQRFGDSDGSASDGLGESDGGAAEARSA